MTTRMDKINKYAAELRAMLADQDGMEIAQKHGIPYSRLDLYDSRIGGSIRELALSNMEKWGEW